VRELLVVVTTELNREVTQEGFSPSLVEASLLSCRTGELFFLGTKYRENGPEDTWFHWLSVFLWLRREVLHRLVGDGSEDLSESVKFQIELTEVSQIANFECGRCGYDG
jgi:hypothetical protein